MNVEFKAIGFVKSAVTQQTDFDWGEVVSQIVLEAEYEKGLIGLMDFSHINVIFYLNQAKFEYEHHLLRRPRGREDMPMLGIFSQRAKDRPNPIGITSVEILGVEKNIVTVKGLDAINGTPVLDIKPYIPAFDKRDNAVVPEWNIRLMQNYF